MRCKDVQLVMEVGKEPISSLYFNSGIYIFFFFFLKILIYWVLISLVQFIIDFFNTVYIGDMFGV